MPTVRLQEDRLLERVLTTQCGFGRERVLVMTDEAGNPRRIPDGENILIMTGNWLRLPEPRDTVVMFFSGHGCLGD